MRQPGTSAWSTLGNFLASEEEILELREALAGHDDPFAAMGEITNQMVWDTLEAIKAEGCQARIVFHSDQ
jgi:hypothetical protein